MIIDVDFVLFSFELAFYLVSTPLRVDLDWFLANSAFRAVLDLTMVMFMTALGAKKYIVFVVLF